MEWETIEIGRSARSTYGAPAYASVSSRGMALNKAAIELIGNIERFSYVELLRGRSKGCFCLGLRFLTEKNCTVNSIPFSQRKSSRDADDPKGITIRCKHAFDELFGAAAATTKSTQYTVEKDKTADNILIILVPDGK